MNIRDNAIHCEAKKHAYRQTQDGVVVSFVLHPQEVPEGLAIAALGTRYMLALVEIGDDEKPKAGSSSGKTPAFEAESGGSSPSPAAKSKTWHELKASQQAGIRCNEPAFHKFLNEGVRIGAVGNQRAWSKPVTNTDEAAEAVRYLCAVNSRADLDKGTGTRWGELESKYFAWQQEPGVVG